MGSAGDRPHDAAVGHPGRRRLLDRFRADVRVPARLPPTVVLLVLLLVSLFLALAVEPGVNRLAARGWRRGRATITILLAVMFALLLFVAAVGTLVGTQVAELLEDSDSYITDTVDFLNDTFGTEIEAKDVIDEFNDPDGRVQQFIKSQSDEAVQFSLTILGVIFQGLSVVLFTYYLVADGPRLRRAVCSRLPRHARNACCRRGNWRSPRRADISTRGRCSRCCRRSSTGSCSRRSARQPPSRSPCGSVSSASSSPSSVRTWPASSQRC